MKVRYLIIVLLAFLSLPLFALGEGKLLAYGNLYGYISLILGTILIITDNIIHFYPFPHISKWGEWKTKQGRMLWNWGMSSDIGTADCRSCTKCGHIQCRNLSPKI
jgi:hypothetical protein